MHSSSLGSSATAQAVAALKHVVRRDTQAVALKMAACSSAEATGGMMLEYWRVMYTSGLQEPGGLCTAMPRSVLRPGLAY
jgi:hypothetical protein